MLNKKRIIKWVLLIIWMIVIFLFSHQAHSGDTTHSILEQIFPFINNNNDIDILNFIIRKSAHITEYIILSLLTISLLKEYTKEERIIILLSIIISFTYACTDEFHQIFVPGRSGQLIDVLIDGTGVATGTCICLLVIKLIESNRKNRTEA